VQKLRELEESKREAVLAMDFERAKRIKEAIERLRGIGSKLNELMVKKRQALER